MDTYFARHTSDIAIDAETRERLWREHLVGVHYPDLKDRPKEDPIGACDNESVDPADYPKRAARAIRALRNLADGGGYVCAQYHGKERCLAGKVLPGSAISLLRGTWESPKYPGRPAVLKTVQISSPVELEPRQYAQILAGRPRQGTLQRWPAAGDLIRRIVENDTTPMSVSSLQTHHQEVLCAEFLRSPIAEQEGLPQLLHLLLPVGRTLMDLDIVGVATDEKRLFAQVTHLPLERAQEKLQRLALYSSGTECHNVLFCRCSGRTQVGGVVVYPLARAFELFTGSGSGRQWLSLVSEPARPPARGPDQAVTPGRTT